MKIVLEASTHTAPSERKRRPREGRRATAPDGVARFRRCRSRWISAAMTGDEAEQATIAAVDAAVLAEQPFLRIIHGMGTGVVRERVRRVVSSDRRVTEVRLRAAQPGRHRGHHRRVLRMSMIPDETIEQVRESADLVGLIGEAVSSSGPAPTTGALSRSTAAPIATSPSFRRRTGTTASSATPRAMCSPSS